MVDAARYMTTLAPYFDARSGSIDGPGSGSQSSKNMKSFVQGALGSYAVCTVLLIVAETVLNTLIITRKGYTEIDWKAYMEEVEPFIVRYHP